MVGLPKRRASSSGAPLPTSRDLDRKRETWLANQHALDATRARLEGADGKAVTADPQDAEAWHAARAEHEATKTLLRAETDRLVAATEASRLDGLETADAIHSAPIVALDDEIAADSQREAAALAIASAARASRERCEAERRERVETREQALNEFATAEGKRARSVSERQQAERIRGFARARLEGLPTENTTPAEERLIAAAVRKMQVADVAARSQPYEQTAAAQAAGVVKLADGQSSAFPRR